MIFAPPLMALLAVGAVGRQAPAQAPDCVSDQDLTAIIMFQELMGMGAQAQQCTRVLGDQTVILYWDRFRNRIAEPHQQNWERVESYFKRGFAGQGEEKFYEFVGDQVGLATVAAIQQADASSCAAFRSGLKALSIGGEWNHLLAATAHRFSDARQQFPQNCR